MRKDSSYYKSSIEVLQGSTLFKGVDKKMMEEILGHFTPTTLPKKTLIYSSQTKTAFYIILKGRVKLSQINPETGHEYIIFILEAGDAFDIIPLLDGEEHEVIIEAIDELQLLKTPMETARNWLEVHPEFNKNFLPYLGNRMRILENSATNLALYDTITRLAKLILQYVQRDEKDYSVKLINDLSHEVLSQMIGSVRKVVNLNIGELKKEGLIDSVRGSLSVKNLEALIERAKL